MHQLEHGRHNDFVVFEETLPPEWAEEITVPAVAKLSAEIQQRTELEAEIETLEESKAALEEWRKLLYESGTPLEIIFSACLEAGRNLNSGLLLR